ncbi:DUF3293 domain-containing protein [Nitrosomonas sp.]|uniref:DUF3293 domain-containing protein n=1 Tax=Nitrosomonas sp. TaxID=42353 RepID=UPI0025D4408E|nr:DUF3293 domain-containing protein [Nitrosomonas sp.]
MQHANTEPTVLSQELIHAYLAARYQARIKPNHSITLRAGDYSAPLATLLQTSGCRNAAYITACNPASQMVTPAENQSATIQLHKQLIRNAAYITACNPASQMVTPAENQSATIQLHKQLIRYSRFIYPGKSTDPAEQWPAEASFLALGINLATATAIGHKFGQNAILWINTDAIPRLVLLR